MSYAIVYSSRTGNTEILAKTIKAAVDESNIIYFGEPSVKALEADIIFVGFWTDKGMCDSSTIDFLKTIKKKRVFLFGTAGFGKSEDYFKGIIKKSEDFLDPSSLIVGTYMCQGRMPISVRERYEKMLESGNTKFNIPLLIENFDQALTHPDVDDLKKLVRIIYELKY